MAKGLSDAEMSANEAPANPVAAIGNIPGAATPVGLTDAQMAAQEAKPGEGGLTSPSNEMLKTGIRAGATGLSYAAKLADMLRGSTTGPILGSALEAATGKKVYSGGDWLNAINPATTSKFPTSNEMMERAGVPKGAQLSDVMPGYAQPGSDHPWFQPEKGGMLDPTVRGTGGTAIDAAIDPLTYLTFGASAAEKKALEQSSPVVRALSKNPVAMTGEVPKPNILGQIGMAPQKAVGWLGDKFYGTPISPIMDQATRKGKTDVDETLFRAGLMNPSSTQSTVEDAMAKLGAARDAIAKKAEDAGATVDINQMTDPLVQLRDKLSSTRQEDALAAGGRAQSMIDFRNKSIGGAPEVAPKIVETASPILDAYGKPIIKQDVIPGVPAIPPTPIGPMEATRIKTAANYKNTPMTLPVDQQLSNAEAVGAQKATENAIGNTLGQGQQKDFADLNSAWGGLLSTRQGQATAEAQANRLANRTFAPDGTSSLVAGMGGGENGLVGATKAVAIKKLMDLMRMGSMPAGYAMKKFGESTVAGPLFDVWSKGQLEKQAGTPVNQGDK